VSLIFQKIGPKTFEAHCVYPGADSCKTPLTMPAGYNEPTNAHFYDKTLI
jgi:hypothetical protein